MQTDHDPLANVVSLQWVCKACGQPGHSEGTDEHEEYWIGCPECGHEFKAANRITWH